MKKFLSLILCAVIISLSLTACSSAAMTEDNITKAVDTAFSALTEFDTKTLKKYVDSPTLSTIMGYAEKHQQFADLGKAMFKNLTYEIKDIDIENEQVTIAVKNKDLFEIATEFAKDLKNNYTAIQLLSKLNDENFLDVKLDMLQEQISYAFMRNHEIEITLKVKKGSKNLVLVFDDDAEDAVSGSALTAIKSIYDFSTK